MSTYSRNIFRCLIVFSILITFLTGCGGIKDQIVGVWTDGQSTMDFKEDGTVSVNMPFNSVNGYWKEADSTHIDIQFSGLLTSFASGRYEIQIKDNIMTVMAATGDSFQLRKFK